MVILFSEICFHECLFPETDLEPEDPVYSGYLFAFLPSSCIEDVLQLPWRDCVMCLPTSPSVFTDLLALNLAISSMHKLSTIC